jgi:hypothetical protein
LKYSKLEQAGLREQTGENEAQPDDDEAAS